MELKEALSILRNRGFVLDNENAIEVNVIHLPQARERKRVFLKYNKVEGVKCVFVEGIDSEKLDVAELREKKLIKAGTVFRTPGCGLAHRALWLASCEMQRPILVCEDDAVVRKDFCAQFATCMAALPKNWDIFMAGYNLDCAFGADVIAGNESFSARFTNRKLDGARLKSFQNIRFPVGVVPLRNAFGTPGYALSPAGAEFLLKNVFPLRNCPLALSSSDAPFRAYTIDGIMNGLFAKMKAYACFPPLVVSPNEKDPNASLKIV